MPLQQRVRTREYGVGVSVIKGLSPPAPRYPQLTVGGRGNHHHMPESVRTLTGQGVGGLGLRCEGSTRPDKRV